ncbi:MAG: YeiH family protein, partial [Parvibaculaceae bacterium]
MDALGSFAYPGTVMSETALALPHSRFRLLPGLLLTSVIAAASFQLNSLPGLAMLSPLIIAIVIGFAVKNLMGTPPAASEGVRFALRWILRSGIVLLGLQLTLGQVAEIGVRGGAAIVLALGMTFLATLGLGRLLGVEARLAQLIAAGTAICGASAVIAVGAATRADDEDVAYAVACVTVFGLLAMFAYPPLAAIMSLDGREYGLWVGASIHEVAQVVGAGYQYGLEAGEFAVATKLARVAMLAPMVLLIAWFARRGGGAAAQARPPLPWFVLGFLLMMGIASSGLVPDNISGGAAVATQVLMAMALAAMGLET